MKVRLTLSANAGIALEMGDLVFWVDALHERKVSGFSTLDEALRMRIFSGEFPKPDLLLYTHLHPDHYSDHLTGKALEKYPHARLILPGERAHFSCGQVHVSYVKTIHEGAQFAEVPHWSVVLECAGKRVFISGDCALAEPSLKGADYDLAVLDFPWLTLRKGRDFLKQNSVANRVVLYHLPFAEDDVNGYRAAARKAADAYPAQTLCDPLQRLELDI